MPGKELDFRNGTPVEPPANHTPNDQDEDDAVDEDLDDEGDE